MLSLCGNDRGCEIVPRLPREIKVDVTKCHACHAKSRGIIRCAIVPRLPRDIKVDVTKCHACHAKRPWMCDCATPNTWNQGGCHQVPRLPRLQVARRHGRHTGPKGATQCHEWSACHAKRPWMCDCATPTTWNQGGCHQVPRLPRRSGAASRASRPPKPGPRAPPSAMSEAPATQNDRGCAIVPRLPRKTTVDVRLCHACHVKSRWMSPSATPASGAASRASRPPKPGPRAPPSAMSEAPATQNDRGCAIVPRLPRDITVDVTKCHACHAKRPWMWDCATPATWNQGGCHQVPRRPRRSGAASRASRPPKPGPRAPPSAMSEAPATQNDRGCAIVPRLPRDIKVDVTKCHACHAKGRGVTGDKSGPSAPHNAISATPATQNDVKRRWMSPSATPVCVCEVMVCERWGVKLWCERWYVTKLWCERWHVTKVC